MKAFFTRCKKQKDNMPRKTKGASKQKEYEKIDGQLICK